MPVEKVVGDRVFAGTVATSGFLQVLAQGVGADTTLARIIRGATLRAYTQDLRSFLRWCTERGVEPLLVERPHLELYLRWTEQQGLAPATIGRRFTTVAGFYRYAVIDGHCDKDPSPAVTRPRVPWEGHTASSTSSTATTW